MLIFCRKFGTMYTREVIFMNRKIANDKCSFIEEYIVKIENTMSTLDDSLNYKSYEDGVFDVLREVIMVFKDDMPNLEDCVIFRNGSADSDARVIIGILRKYLVDNGYKTKDKKETVIDKFWTSFKTYFENVLPYQEFLKDEYIGCEDWIAEKYCTNINYNYQFKLYYGIEYNEEDFSNINAIKLFIELSFAKWIIPDKRYDYTKEVNKIFRKFRLPYKLNKGKIISKSYKTTAIDDKIINFAMLERKIQFAEEMILSQDMLDKKCALDYIVDSLQYLLSIQDGETVKEKYANASLLLCTDKNDKRYSVINNEINEIMKIVNDYFDIRHNEYLNKSKEIRQPITDSAFIEYLYNRIYSLLYLIKLNFKM